jgi:hypothetical protein
MRSSDPALLPDPAKEALGVASATQLEDERQHDVYRRGLAEVSNHAAGGCPALGDAGLPDLAEIAASTASSPRLPCTTLDSPTYFPQAIVATTALDRHDPVGHVGR